MSKSPPLNLDSGFIDLRLTRNYVISTYPLEGIPGGRRSAARATSEVRLSDGMPRGAHSNHHCERFGFHRERAIRRRTARRGVFTSPRYFRSGRAPTGKRATAHVSLARYTGARSRERREVAHCFLTCTATGMPPSSRRSAAPRRSETSGCPTANDAPLARVYLLFLRPFLRPPPFPSRSRVSKCRARDVTSRGRGCSRESRAPFLPREGGGGEGAKRGVGRRRRASRLIRRRASVAENRPVESREPRSWCQARRVRRKKIRDERATGRCTSADVHARSEGCSAALIPRASRAAHYAHIIGPTRRHRRSPTIDPGAGRDSLLRAGFRLGMLSVVSEYRYFRFRYC